MKCTVASRGKDLGCKRYVRQFGELDRATREETRAQALPRVCDLPSGGASTDQR